MTKSIGEIKTLFNTDNIPVLEELISEFSSDEREGVKKIVESASKKIKALYSEIARIEKMKEFEKKYEDMGYVCGIDEVGRGPLAGPVVTGAVILPKDCKLLYLNDSKKLSEKKREELFDVIMENAVSVSLGFNGPERIDEINILNATLEAMRESVLKLSVTPSVCLVDAVKIPDIPMKQVSIIKGDAKSISIAAASIVAKVTRDRLMVEYDSIYPEYNFKSNKGYGSAEHIAALKKYGKTPIHRDSFIGNFI